MRAERPRWRIVPPFARRHVSASRRIERIDDATARLCGFPSDQEQRLALGVANETMGNSSAGGERGQVTSNHSVQVSVDPGIDLALDDIDELLFVLLSMRP